MIISNTFPTLSRSTFGIWVVVFSYGEFNTLVGGVFRVLEREKIDNISRWSLVFEFLDLLLRLVYFVSGVLSFHWGLVYLVFVKLRTDKISQ